MEKGLNLSVKQTALIIGKSEQAVRIGIQRKIFPFGVCMKLGNPKGKHTYHIPAMALADYLHIGHDQMLKLIEELE